MKKLGIFLILLMISLVGTLYAQAVYKFDSSGNPVTIGVLSTAVGTGSSTGSPTNFEVNANVQQVVGISFNATKIDWTIKDGTTLATKLTKGKIDATTDIKMKVGETSENDKMVQDLVSISDSTKMIDTMYAIDIDSAGNKPPMQGSSPLANGSEGWFNTDSGTASINAKTFTTKSAGADYINCTWIKSTDGFAIWNRLNVNSMTGIKTDYQDKFIITVSVDP